MEGEQFDKTGFLVEPAMHGVLKQALIGVAHAVMIRTRGCRRFGERRELGSIGNRNDFAAGATGESRHQRVYSIS